MTDIEQRLEKLEQELAEFRKLVEPILPKKGDYEIFRAEVFDFIRLVFSKYHAPIPMRMLTTKFHRKAKRYKTKLHEVVNDLVKSGDLVEEINSRLSQVIMPAKDFTQAALEGKVGDDEWLKEHKLAKVRAKKKKPEFDPVLIVDDDDFSDAPPEFDPETLTQEETI